MTGIRQKLDYSTLTQTYAENSRELLRVMTDIDMS